MKALMLSKKWNNQRLAVATIGLVLCLALIPNKGKAQVIRLWSDVELVNDENSVWLKWEGTRRVNKVQYRLMEVGEWKTISVNGNKVKISGDLQQDKTYEWKVFVDNEPGVVNYFRTFKIIEDKENLEVFRMVRAVEGARAKVQKVYSDRLQFYYKDDYKQGSYLFGELFDNKYSLVSKIAFKKSEDHVYNLTPTSLNVIWAKDQTYTLKLKDELNPKRLIKFQISEPLGEDLEPEISVNPIVMDCQFGTTSKIEYYGTFVGGNAPYEVVWSIANSDDFNQPLMEPTKMVVEKKSDVAKITIEYPLPYLVVFSVLDGCGNFGEHAVVIQCNEDDEEEFSLLFESVDQNNDDLGKPGNKR